MRMGEFVPLFVEFVEVEAVISNWTEPLRRFAEVKRKTENTTRASRPPETMANCLIRRKEGISSEIDFPRGSLIAPSTKWLHAITCRLAIEHILLTINFL
jgi:hypothetical protein